MKKNRLTIRYLCVSILMCIFGILINFPTIAQSCDQIEIIFQESGCPTKKSEHNNSNNIYCKLTNACVDQLTNYSSTGIGSTFDSFLWEANGPTIPTFIPNTISSSVDVIWDLPGQYTLTLSVTDDQGNVFQDCLLIDVYEKPIADFDFSPNNVCAPSDISFTNNTTSNSGVAYLWDFGDNNYSTDVNPTHQYTSARDYIVTLVASSFVSVQSIIQYSDDIPNDTIITIKSCCSDTISKVVTILDGTFTIDCISTVCSGQEVTYTASGCTNPIWQTPIGGSIVSTNGNEVTISWGDGSVQGVIQADCLGCAVNASVPIIPDNPIPVGNLFPCVGTSSSYTLAKLPGTFYTWHLINSNNLNLDSQLSTFPDNNTVWINLNGITPGVYILSVELENKHLCCGSVGELTIEVKEEFELFGDPVFCEGQSTILKALPLSGYSNNITASYNWEIKDDAGNIITNMTNTNVINHLFLPGNYTAKVTENNVAFCNSTEYISFAVEDVPVSGVIIGDVIVCEGSQRTYTMSIDAPDDYYYEWNIIGGTIAFIPGSVTNTIGNNITIDWIALQGSISVTLTQNDNPHCTAPPVNLIINKPSQPLDINGPISSCVDNIETYEFTGIPIGENVDWTISPSNRGTIISGNGTANVDICWHGETGNTTTWAPITLTASSNCGDFQYGPIIIHPKFNLSISQSGEVCTSSGVTLTASGAPVGSIYNWFYDSPTIIGSGTTINVDKAGWYMVTVDQGGCRSTQNIMVVYPDILTKELCCGYGGCDAQGNIVQQLQISNINNASYLWYEGRGNTANLINGETSNIYQATDSGFYFVEITRHNCVDTLPFYVKPFCCPDVNMPQIIVDSQITCNEYKFVGITDNPNNSSITWDFGDGTIVPGVSGVPIYYTFQNAGIYCVKFIVGPPSPNPTDCIGNCTATTVTVPIDARFIYSLGCDGRLKITNTSVVISPDPNFVTYLWDFGDGTTSSSANPSIHQYINPGTYNVKLIITYDNNSGISCQSEMDRDVIYKSFAIEFQSPVCSEDIVYFNTNDHFNSYSWDFGDNTTAYINRISHAYSYDSDYTVNLTVIDKLGTVCATDTVVTVYPGIHNCKIEPGYLCSGKDASLVAPDISGCSYLWEEETNPNVYVSTHIISRLFGANHTGRFRVVITDNTTGCICISNTVDVIEVDSPVAEINVSPSTQICDQGNVLISTPEIPGYIYNWTYIINNTLQHKTSSFFNQFFNTTTTIKLVVENEYGCTDSCELSILVDTSPDTPIIMTPTPLCEGTAINLTVNNYSTDITWNTGASTTSIIVNSAGEYIATYTDPNTGCISDASIVIRRLPPIDLFPYYCDSIFCDSCRNDDGSFTIYAPKPIIGQFSNYDIKWFDLANNILGSGPELTITSSGSYYIEISDGFCSATSNVYTVYLEDPCDCYCENSIWGETSLQVEGNSENAVCGTTMNVMCNETIDFFAQYICDDSNCNGLVTYSLEDPNGFITSGDVPLSFIASNSGVYTLKTYGWCGNIICDSCEYVFNTVCDPIPCCPQIDDIVIRRSNAVLTQQSINGNDYSLYTADFQIRAGNIPYKEVRATVISYVLRSNYEDCIECYYQPFTSSSISGSTLAGIDYETTGAIPTTSYVVPSNINANPRELVWDNGQLIDLNLTQTTNLSFYLPAENEIPCCELKATICVRFSFIDIDCNLCEKDVCFEVIIGDPTNPVEPCCCCGSWDRRERVTINNKPPFVIPSNKSDVIIAEQINKEVDCGGIIELKKRIYWITPPTFNCSSNDCSADYVWKIENQSGVILHQGVGKKISYNFTFIKGNYTITITPSCDNNQCDPCIFTIKIKNPFIKNK